MRLSLPTLLILSLLWICPKVGHAQIDLNPANPKPMVANQPPEEPLSDQTGFVKPYDYERQALGYDPDGIIYRENEPEDFQVIFITSLPFTTAVSFGLTGLVSLVLNGHFSVGGGYFYPFLGGMLGGSTTVACISVLSNSYPPPESNSIVQLPGTHPTLAFNMPLMTAQF